MTNDELNALIEGIGPINAEIDAILRLSEVEFTVGFEDVSIDIEFDAPLNKLMFSVELGAPPAADALRVYEFLLTYAAAWKSTGGLGIALTSPGGSLVLTFPLFAGALTSARLSAILTNLARRATVLKGLVAAGAAEEADTGSSLLQSDAMIKV